MDFLIYEKHEGKLVPTGVIPTLLAQHIRETERYFLLDTGGEKPPWYWYDDNQGVYNRLDKNLVMYEIKKHIEAVDPQLVRTRDLEEVYKLLITDKQRVPIDLVNTNPNIINFQNGVLDITANELLPHSPDYLSTIQIPCNYNPNAKDCPVFKQYLKDLADGDKEVGNLFWEYLALVISNIAGHVTKKALFLIGEGDTGKSQYLALLAMLVGKRNFAAIDLKNLEERFATNQMLDKRLAGCADMSFMQISELKMFKKLTGGDAITFEAKGKDAISATYNGCLVFCSNAKPNFGGDKGDHVYRRILAVPCNNVIPDERRDPDICNKMFAEREAIVNIAIGYLRRFIARGNKFDEPQVCKAFRDEYKLENDNVLMFIAECTAPRDEVNHDVITAHKEFYEIYRRWATENGFTPLNRVNFAQRLKAAGVTEQRLGHSGTRCYSVEPTAAVIEHYTEWMKNKS